MKPMLKDEKLPEVVLPQCRIKKALKGQKAWSPELTQASVKGLRLRLGMQERISW